MGFFSSNKKSTSASTYTPNVPEWLKGYYESNTANANTLAQGTAEDRVAGFSQDQLKVQDFLSNLLGQGSANYQSGIDSILGQMNNGAGNFNAQSYQDYMNPYINEVIQNQNNELVRTGDINRNKIRDNAAMTNAFGSGRADLMEQEANRNLNQQVSENTATGMASAFNWANNMALQANQANTANTTGLASALGSLTGVQSSNAISQANALNTVGTQQQQLAQAQLDVPYNNVSWLSGILGQVPASIYGATTTNQTSTPGAGWGQQALGLGLTAAGLFSGSPMLAAGGANMAMKADGGRVTPDSTNASLRGIEQTLMGLNQSSLDEAMAREASKSQGGQDMTGGLTDLFTKMMKPSSAEGMGGINGQAVNTTASMPVYAANGGHITKNYAEGGFVERLLGDKLDPLTNWRKTPFGAFNSLAKELVVDPVVNIPTGLAGTGFAIVNDLAGNKNAAKYHKQNARNLFSEAFTSEGSRRKVPAVGNAIKDGISWLNEVSTPQNIRDKDIKENEAAMADALAKKQAAAPKTGPVDQERNFMNSILANGDILPPPRTSDNPMEPSSAITDVTQAAINPVITDTVKEQQGPSQGFIEKYLASQSSASTPKEETWMDRVNMPLVLAGAAMMGSNKPFLGAIAEGIGAGAGQIQREKSAKADSESKAKENAQKLLDSLINAQYRNEQIRLGEERLKVSDRAVSVQEKQQAAKEKNAAGNERKAMEFARKQTEAEMKAFEASYDGIKATREQKDAMRSRLQQKYYDDYMAGSFGSGVINELPNSVQSDLNDTSENTGGMLDFNELAKKFSK